MSDTATQPPHAPHPEPAQLQPDSPDNFLEMANLPPAAIARTISSSTPAPNSTTIPSSSQSEAITPARLPPTLSDSPDSSTVAETSTAAVAEPAVTVTLLLPSGKRYPYTLNAKYLRKRKEVVTVQDDDPSKVTVYFMKLLLLHDWKEGTCATTLIVTSLEPAHKTNSSVQQNGPINPSPPIKSASYISVACSKTPPPSKIVNSMGRQAQMWFT